MRKTTRRLGLVLVLALLGGMLVLAVQGRGGGPPTRLWTSEPNPSRPGPAGTLTANVRSEPDGARVRGWDASWIAAFGPAGTTDLDWRILLLPSASLVDWIRWRFSEDQWEPEYFEFDESGATVRIGEVTWKEWIRRRPPLEDGR